MKPRVKLGDIFEIPLSNRKKTYGQYIFMDKQYGPIVKIFDCIIDQDQIMDCEKVVQSKLLFPPIIMGIFATIREGVWKVVANIKVANFQYPKFLRAMWDPGSGKASKWFIWDGTNSVELGDRVANKYRDLEYLGVYPPDLVVNRIEKGTNFFKHMIDTNYYRPDQVPKS